MSRLGKQLGQVVAALDRIDAAYALIGGLALASHKVVRATMDIDLLTELRSADEVHDVLLALDYRCAHRSTDAATYLRDDERIDLLYASRPIARRLLDGAATRETSFGVLRVVSPEGLIGFKLLGLVNDPRRTQDLEDIRALLRANRTTLDIDEIREYFRLFERDSPEPFTSVHTHPSLMAGSGARCGSTERDPYETLDDLMCVIEELCPRWPPRPIHDEGTALLL
ncbi:MAG: hypothetical protein AB7P31_02710 [Steroidobacteraceae bacterium]